MSVPPSENDPEDSASSEREYLEATRKFWSGNIRITLALLAVWAFAGLGCGILFADQLNAYKIGGYPLGFWFAQQGSIIVFVLLILVFCLVMNKRDAKHHRDYVAKRVKKTGGER